MIQCTSVYRYQCFREDLRFYLSEKFIDTNIMIKYTDSILSIVYPEFCGSKFLLSSLKNNMAIFKETGSEDERYVEFVFSPSVLSWHHRPSSFGVY